MWPDLYLDETDYISSRIRNEEESSFKVTDFRNDIAAIAKLLETEPEWQGNECRLKISTQDGSPVLVLTVSILSDDSVLVSAQTSYGYFELHGVARHVPVDPNEVIFVAEKEDGLSALVVGGSGNCSLFANVNPSILKSDLSSLDSALLLSAMQLGLTETVSPGE